MDRSIDVNGDVGSGPSGSDVSGEVVAIIPAKDSRTVEATVRALRSTGRVDRCVVVDDGSSDDTAVRARAAGATVAVLPVNWGKGDAVRLAVREFADAAVYLLVDADLGDTARHTVALLDPVVDGSADVAIAAFPSAGGRGGFGFVKRAAGSAIRRLSGYDPVEPLSGQRAVRGDVLRHLALAPRFGLEAAMTVDAVRAGLRIVELPLPVDHDHTGRSFAGFRHRGAQAVDIARGLAVRCGTPTARRTALGLCTVALLVTLAVPAWQRDRTGPALATGADRRPTVLVTVTDTSLADLDRGVLPNIGQLMAGTGGALTTRLPSGPQDQLSAFASLGAGAPVTVRGTPVRSSWSALLRPVGVATASTVPDVALVRSGAGWSVRTSTVPTPTDQAFGTAGSLGTALHDAGVATGYVGARSDAAAPDGELRTPAALAIADATGRVDDVVAGSLPASPGPATTEAIAARSVAVGDALEKAGVVVVDAGGSQEPWPAGVPMTSEDRVGRHERRLDQVRVADELVGRIVADHPGALVIVAGISPASHWRLTPLAASGQHAGALWSPSTRQPGVSVLTDLGPTLLAATGVAVPDAMVGQRLSAGPDAADVAAIQDLHDRTVDREGLTAALTVTFISVQGAIYAAALLGLSLRRRRTRVADAPSGHRGISHRPTSHRPISHRPLSHRPLSHRLLSATERLALGCASLPVVTFLYRLAPTWAQEPAVAAVAITLGSALLAAVALRFRRHPLSPLVVVATVTALTMAVDAATSGMLQNVSLLGYTPLTAARYYGMGNLGFAVFGSSVILLAGAWVSANPSRRDGVFAAACVFAGVVVVQVSPVMGADFGGALVLVPTALLASAAWSGVRITPRRVLWSALATLGVVGVLAGVDVTLGGGSHVARFFGAGPAGMWEVVRRKADSNLRVLTTTSWTWLVVVVGIFAIGAVLLAGRRAGWFRGAPAWRTTLVTMIGFGVLGGLVNDSGIAIPSMVAVYVGALLLLLARRTPFAPPQVLEPAPSV